MCRFSERTQCFKQGQPGKIGEVEALLLRETANVINPNLPYEVRKDRTSSYTVENTYGMIENIKIFTTTDNVRALMALGDAVKLAFNDRFGEVLPRCN